MILICAPSTRLMCIGLRVASTTTAIARNTVLVVQKHCWLTFMCMQSTQCSHSSCPTMHNADKKRKEKNAVGPFASQTSITVALSYLFRMLPIEEVDHRFRHIGHNLQSSNVQLRLGGKVCRHVLFVTQQERSRWWTCKSAQCSSVACATHLLFHVESSA